MATNRPDDLAALLTPARQAPDSFSQGFLTAWNASTYANTVEVGGATLTDLPLALMGTPDALTADCLVLLLRVRNTFYILGKITHP